MIRRNRAKSSSLFLLELILAILFFSIASAVCVQFFVKSHLLSRDAKALNAAVTEVSNVAELIDVSDGIPSALELLLSQYPDARTDKTATMSIYFDQDFQSCPKQDGAYVLTVDLRTKDQMLYGKLDMRKSDDSSSIYSLDISHHLQRRAGNGI